MIDWKSNVIGLDDAIDIVDSYGPTGADVNEDFQIKMVMRDAIKNLRFELSASQAREAELREKLEAAEENARELMRALNREIGGDTFMGDPTAQKSLVYRLRELDIKGYQLLTGAIGEEAAQALEAAEARIRELECSVIEPVDVECFRKLGEYLSNALEEDQFNSAEKLLNSCLLAYQKLESLIKASQEQGQEPVAIVKGGVINWKWCKQFDHGQLFAQPPIPPELAELQRQVEFWKRSAQEWKLAYVAIGGTASESGKEELRKLLESKMPEGWQLVPKNPTDSMMRAAAKLDAEALQGVPHGYEELYAAMLNAAPQPKESKQ